MGDEVSELADAGLADAGLADFGPTDSGLADAGLDDSQRDRFSDMIWQKAFDPQEIDRK